MDLVVTPIAYVRAITLAYARYGIDATGLLRQARIAPSLLGRRNARLSSAQMEAISAAAMRELDDEALGWWSRRLPWGSYGMLARASLTAPDLQVALKRWLRHHRLICDDIGFRLDIGGASTVTLSLQEDRPPWPGTRELCLTSTLRSVHSFASWIVDSRIVLQRVRMPFAAPPWADAYAQLFGCEPEFEAPAASMSFDAAYLALSVQRGEHAMRALLHRVLPLNVQPYRRDRLLMQRVRDMQSRRPETLASAEALATALNVSVRTLHRQLGREGISLQQLKNESRQARAVDLLTRTRKSIKQIATEVGFGSEKSFARAFRQWTGRSPSALRDEHG